MMDRDKECGKWTVGEHMGAYFRRAERRRGRPEGGEAFGVADEVRSTRV
jgi:hypothetical protein